MRFMARQKREKRIALSLGKHRYREVFFAHNGPGPYTCCFCGQPVDFEEVVIHHVDHNRTNLARENLTAAHETCHKSHHHKGKIVSAEARANIGAASAGRWVGRKHRPETIAKMHASAHHRPRTHPDGCECKFCDPSKRGPVSDATRRKMSSSQRRRRAREPRS